MRPLFFENDEVDVHTKTDRGILSPEYISDSQWVTDIVSKTKNT